MPYHGAPKKPETYDHRIARLYKNECRRRNKEGLEPLTYEQYAYKLAIYYAHKQELREQGKTYRDGTKEHGVLSVAAASLEEHDVNKHVLDQIVRQEGGSRLRGYGWTTIGPGCFRKNRLYN